jgi:hypothetical protein
LEKATDRFFQHLLDASSRTTNRGLLGDEKVIRF